MSSNEPGVRDLPDLATEVRARVVTPPYDAVSRRVRARRRLLATGTVAAAVLLVGGVAVAQQLASNGTHTLPRPAASQGPVPMTDESMWRAVVDGTDSHPFQVEGTDDGSIAVVWRALEPGSPTFALVIRDADGNVHGMRLDEPVSLTPVPGGWVGVNTARGYFIGTDGSWTDLGSPGAGRAPLPADVVVSGQYGLWLFSPGDRSWSRMSFDGVADDVWLAKDGAVITCAHEEGRIVLRRDAHEIVAVPGDTCALAGRGDAFAMVGLGDDPDGAIPMTGLATWDAGTLSLPRLTTMLSGVTSVVVTPDRTTVVTNASDGRSIVIPADGGRAQLDRKVGEAFVAGDRLYVTSYGFMNGPISYSDDDGATWTQTTLPGNESKQE